MAIPKRGRTRRFGVLLDIKYKEFLWNEARRTHRSPVKYVEMLLDKEAQELRAQEVARKDS